MGKSVRELAREKLLQKAVEDPNVDTSVPAVIENYHPKDDSEEEEDLEPWTPTGDFEKDLASLTVFQNFRRLSDNKKMSKKEVDLSFTNFHKWLDGEIDRLVEEVREKEKDLFK